MMRLTASRKKVSSYSAVISGMAGHKNLLFSREKYTFLFFAKFHLKSSIDSSQAGNVIYKMCVKRYFYILGLILKYQKNKCSVMYCRSTKHSLYYTSRLLVSYLCKRSKLRVELPKLVIKNEPFKAYGMKRLNLASASFEPCLTLVLNFKVIRFKHVEQS